MTSCWACETQLRPEWKYCIQCGVPVEGDSDAAEPGRRAAGPLALYGWIVAGIVSAIAIALVIIIAVSQ